VMEKSLPDEEVHYPWRALTARVSFLSYLVTSAQSLFYPNLSLSLSQNHTIDNLHRPQSFPSCQPWIFVESDRTRS
jgi:hypothetical protein